MISTETVVYGLDVSVEPEKCAWVLIDKECKVIVGEPGVGNLVESLNKHLDCTIYFGMEAPMWIPLLTDGTAKMSSRFVEEKNREWYRDSGAGASLKSMVLWDFIRKKLGRDLSEIDIRPFEGYATGCYKPTTEQYSKIMTTFESTDKKWVTEDMVDAYIIAHARWAELLQCENKIIDSYYEKLIKDQSNLSGSFKSLWDGLEADKTKSPTIYGYKFQWHLEEIVKDEKVSFSGDDLRIYIKTSEISIKMRLEQKYQTLKFSIPSNDHLKIKSIIVSNEKEGKTEESIILGENKDKKTDYIIHFDNVVESTLKFLFKEIESKTFISLKKPYLEKVSPQPVFN